MPQVYFGFWWYLTDGIDSVDKIVDEIEEELVVKRERKSKKYSFLQSQPDDFCFLTLNARAMAAKTNDKVNNNLENHLEAKQANFTAVFSSILLGFNQKSKARFLEEFPYTYYTFRQRISGKAQHTVYSKSFKALQWTTEVRATQQANHSLLAVWHRFLHLRKSAPTCRVSQGPGARLN